MKSQTVYKGLIVAISSPSGGGKTSVIHRLLQQNDLSLCYSVSMTTRPRREGEVDGKDYWFVDEKAFCEQIDNNDLVEYEKVHGYYYGTPRQPLLTWLNQDKIVLFDIDVNGALKIQHHFPHNSLLIFLAPPDTTTLKARLLHRGSESTREIQKRLRRVDLEMEKSRNFDEIIVNENLNKTVKQIKEIIKRRFYDVREVKNGFNNSSG